MNKLEEICANRATHVESNKRLYPVPLLEKSIHFKAATISLESYIKRADKSGIIAEFKRKSPSKGVIDGSAGVKETTIAYMQGGASALSVLTEPDYFAGKDSDLKEARQANYCPILRKDFIVDEYQLIEARSIGADAILLIAAVLDKKQLQALHATAKNLGLEVLIEVHSEKELDQLPDGEFLLGVNNRDLTTMSVDIETSLKMAELLGDHRCTISESGLHSPQDLVQLRKAGYDGFLIGEAFMRAAQAGKEVQRFTNALIGTR